MTTRSAPAPGVDRASLWAAALTSQLAAGWLVIRGDARDGTYDVPAFAALVAQLTLTVGWLLLFFRLRRPALALVNAAVLWLATVLTAREFARRHRVAAALVLPYLVWVSYAAGGNAVALARRLPRR
jgi:benzodiazapine receptor